LFRPALLIALLLTPLAFAQGNADSSPSSGNAQADSSPLGHVFVEPWQTLVRETVAVSAGRAVQYSFTLPSRTALSAQFQVQGGLNNAIRVFLLDAPNYELYAAHRPFLQYQGASGLVRGIGSYDFRVPRDGVYYVILDNGQAWLMPRNVTLHLDAILPEGAPTSDQLQTALETLYSWLTQLFIFSDFQTSVRHCGVANAFSDPNITMCVELVEEIQAKGVPNAFTFVYLHELGHTLMRQWGLPLWDNEDAADEFATAVLLIGRQPEIALQAAQWWASEGASTQDAVARIWMDDRHSLSPQRARNIIRWVNNATDIVPRWQHMFVPNMQTAMLESMMRDPAVSDKDFINSELRRRGVSH